MKLVRSLLFESKKILRGIHHAKRLSSKSVHKLSPETSQATEVKIPVPWGHIAGKWWGPQNVRPILGLHGWLDNCGSFDTLAPLLPKHVAFLAIDYPGHGLSSRFPNGVFYNSLDYHVIIRRIAKYYAWDKVSLLGHSMGGANVFMYSAIFPENVEFAIGLDALKPVTTPPDKFATQVRKQIEEFLILDERNMDFSQPPTFKYEDFVDKLYHGSDGSIAKENCHYLLDRSIQKSSRDPDKYFFTRDGRLKTYSFPKVSHEECLELSKRISSPYLAIKGKQGSYFEDPVHYYRIVDSMRSVNPGFEFHLIDGTHHVHLNEPQKISNIINSFINKHYTPYR